MYAAAAHTCTCTCARTSNGGYRQVNLWEQRGLLVSICHDAFQHGVSRCTEYNNSTFGMQENVVQCLQTLLSLCLHMNMWITGLQRPRQVDCIMVLIL